MAVVPGFQYDVFVSYAHRNDVPWGWVSDFIQTLKAELEGKSRDFRIWWDPGLRTGEDFNLAIAKSISKSAVFLSVLSLAYEEVLVLPAGDRGVPAAATPSLRAHRGQHEPHAGDSP